MDIKYVNLVQIGPVAIVMKIQGVENDNLAFPLNSSHTCVPHIFLGH